MKEVDSPDTRRVCPVQIFLDNREWLDHLQTERSEYYWNTSSGALRQRSWHSKETDVNSGYIDVRVALFHPTIWVRGNSG
jgi:hypothetical protein